MSGDNVARAVYRSLGELRRGTAVLLEGARPTWLLAAETASARSLAEAGQVAHGPVTLLVSADRVGGPEGELAGFHLAPSFGALAGEMPGLLADLADPTRRGAPASLENRLSATFVPEDASAGLALLKLARLAPACVMAEGGDDSVEQARSLGLLTVAVADILAFPRQTGLGLEIVAQASVPLEDAAEARLVAFRPDDGGIEHLAVVIGTPAERTAPLVRLHSECFTGDFLGSLRCDCGEQLRHAIRRMREEGDGVLLYLAQEGRGIGLVNKLRAYALQDRGLDTLDANRALGWDADERSFLIAATMLRRLDIGRIRLLTNNPEKVAALEGYGIEVVERVGHAIPPNGVNDGYLATKQRRFGHVIG